MAPVPSRLRLLALLSVPLAGLMVAWLVLSSGAPERADGAPRAEPLVERPTSELLAVEQQVETEESEPAPDASASATDEAHDEPVEPESGREARVAPQAEPATGTIVRGRLDPPVAGALVLAGGAGVLPLDAPASVRAAGGDPRKAGRGLTNAAGEFAIHGLAPGRLRLAVRGEGLAPLDLDHLWLLAGEDLDLGDLVLEQPAPLYLSVVDARGLPVAEAAVGRAPASLTGPWTALSSDAFAPLGRASAVGSFQALVPAGPWRLCVEAPARPPTHVTGFARPGETLELVVTLQDGAGVGGELVDVDGVHGAGAGLRVGAFSLAEPLVTFADLRAAGLPRSVLASYRETATDTERRFELSGLRAGESLRVRILFDEPFEVPDAFSPTVSARAGDQGLELFARAGAGLEFEAVDLLSGARVEKLEARLPGVSPRDLGELGGSSGLARWSGLRAHALTLEPLYADLPESADLVLELAAPGFDLFQSPGFRLRSGEVTRLGALGMRSLSPVHVRVLDARRGHALEGAVCELVAAAPQQAQGLTSSAATTGSDGRARLTTLGSNAADLVVRCPGFAPWRGRAPRAPARDDPFEVLLVPGGTLRARALDGARAPVRAQVLRRRAGAETSNALEPSFESKSTDVNGWALFTDLETSMWSLAARALPRSDLEIPFDPGSTTWVGGGCAEGQVNEIDVVASPVFALELELAMGDDPLAHALVRLQPGADGFLDPHADAVRLAVRAAERCGEAGRAVFEGLSPGEYTIQVEHPDAPPGNRWPVVLEPGSRYQRIDLATPVLRGQVLDEDGDPARAVVELTAYSGAWYEGLELEVGASLRDIVPQPIVVARRRTDGSGNFVFRGVPRDVSLRLSAEGRRATGEYYIESVPARPEPTDVVVYLEPSVSFPVLPSLTASDPVPRELGLIALHREQPWGRGVVAAAFERGPLQFEHVPRGRWQMRLVGLEGGHVVTALGEWFEVDDPFDGQPIALPWRAR